jgi:DNA-binding NtrC family response regulator
MDVGSTLPDTETVDRGTASDLGLLWIYPDPQPRFTSIENAMVVGRESTSGIVLSAGNVSRRHVLVRRSGPLLVAEDLGSRNGTYVEGRRIEKANLAEGAVLRVGEALAIVWKGHAGESPHFCELAPGFFGGSTLAARMRDLERVAASGLFVVVEGRTGAGKEGIATAIHHYSRRSGRFVAINCATLQPSLVESQLFGHRRGAFTGAERNEIGLIGSADRGTLFLDEVLELSPLIQSKLLRVLQQNEYLPLGETRPVGVDLRVVAASQKPLEQAVAAGEFREDLFARLNGYSFRVPELSERRADIPYLFRHFLNRQFGGRPPVLRARLLEALCLKSWPRNVRELETLAKRVGVLHGHVRELRLEHLLDVLDESDRRALSGDTPDADPAATVGSGREDRELAAALSESEGNVVQAARKLGVSRASIYRRILALGIDVRDYRAELASGKRRGGD